MLEVIKAEQYKETTWSGGVTREIFIAPKGAEYATREFKVRISTATVDDEESDFTVLPGVERFLTTLSDELQLTFDDGEMVKVDNHTIVHFLGDRKVHCVGKAPDMNLMLKDGAKGEMYRVEPQEEFYLEKDYDYVLFAEQEDGILRYDEDCFLRLKKGNCCHGHNLKMKCRWDVATRSLLVIKFQY